MRYLFYCGMILIGVGLLFAAMETAAHGYPGANLGLIVSAQDLWYTLRPKSLLIMEIRAERLAPWLWDPVLLTFLTLPAWAIFGIPGGLLVWLGQSGHSGKDDDDIKEVLASFDLFDELTRQAKEENPAGENHGPHDMLPDDLIGEDIAPDANAPGEFEPFSPSPRND